MLQRKRSCTTGTALKCWRCVTGLHIIERMPRICFRKVLSKFFYRYILFNKGAFEGWIRRIIVHTCINHLKKNKRFNESVDIIQASSVQIREENIPSIVQAKQIVDCIRLLPVGYRTVLNLYAIEGYAHKEIAEMLDIEESTSRSQYTRARQMLEDILIRRNLITTTKDKTDRLTAIH